MGRSSVGYGFYEVSFGRSKEGMTTSAAAIVAQAVVWNRRGNEDIDSVLHSTLKISWRGILLHDGSGSDVVNLKGIFLLLF